MRKAGALLAAAGVLLAAMAGASAAAEIERDFNRSFEVERGWALRLRHGDGDVVISPWDRDILQISVHYHAEHKGLGDDSKSDFEVEFSEKNGLIEVVGREKKTGFLGIHLFILKEYTYTISAPAYLELDLKGDDGDIDIEKWEGNIEVDIDDGSVSLFECSVPKTRIKADDARVSLEGHTGMLDVRGGDGPIEIGRGSLEECRILLDDGDIRIHDSEGNFDIEVDDARSELLRVRTRVMELESEDGSFDVELLGNGEIDLEIRTDDGDVDLGLERGISASFAIDVDDGRIRTDLPGATSAQKGRNWMSGVIGDGKGRIRIRTMDGSVTLREIR